jgi:tail protein
MLKVDKIEFWLGDYATYTIDKSQLEFFPLIGGNAADTITTRVWNQHGDTYIDAYMQPIDGEISFALHTMWKNREEVLQMRKEITDICNPLNGKLQMKVFLNTGDIFNQDITFRTVPSFPTGKENRNVAYQRVILSYTAHNPFWYSENEIVESFQAVDPLFYFPFTMEGESSQITGGFVDKITGSVVENPNKFRYRQATALAANVTDFTTEVSQSHYDAVEAAGGTTSTYGTTTSGNIPQMLWSFDILQLLERRYGISVWQGVTTLSEKVARAKKLVTYLKWTYTGYATNSAGNSITLQSWRSDTNVFYGAANFTNSTATLHNITNSIPANNIDSSGFVHMMAYTTASNGTVASNLISDYVSLNVSVTLDYKPDPVLFGNIRPNNIAVNEGQVPAPVTIRIFGACINPKISKIINGNETAYIKFKNLTLGADDMLEIQTAFGEKGVWLNGQSVFNKLDFSSEFFSLDVGENEIEFTDESGNRTAAIHFIYKNLYLTV